MDALDRKHDMYSYCPYGENGNAEQDSHLFNKILKSMTSLSSSSSSDEESSSASSNTKYHPALLIDDLYLYTPNIGADNLLAMLAACKRHMEESSDGNLYKPEWSKNSPDYSGKCILDHVKCPEKPGAPCLDLLQRLILLSLDSEEIADADFTNMRALDRDFNLGKLVKTFFDNRAASEADRENVYNEYIALYDFVNIANNGVNNNSSKGNSTIANLGCCCYFHELKCLEVHKTKFMKCSLFLARFDELKSMVNEKKTEAAFKSQTLNKAIQNCLETMNEILKMHLGLCLVQRDPVNNMDVLLSDCRIGRFSTSTGEMLDYYDSLVDTVISVFKSKENAIRDNKCTTLDVIETKLRSFLRGERRAYLGYAYYFIGLTPDTLQKCNNKNKKKRTKSDHARQKLKRAARKQKAISGPIVAHNKSTGKRIKYKSIEEMADAMAREIIEEKAKNQFFASRRTVGSFVSDCEEAVDPKNK